MPKFHVRVKNLEKKFRDLESTVNMLISPGTIIFTALTWEEFKNTQIYKIGKWVWCDGKNGTVNLQNRFPRVQPTHQNWIGHKKNSQVKAQDVLKSCKLNGGINSFRLTASGHSGEFNTELVKWAEDKSPPDGHLQHYIEINKTTNGEKININDAGIVTNIKVKSKHMSMDVHGHINHEIRIDGKKWDNETVPDHTFLNAFQRIS